MSLRAASNSSPAGSRHKVSQKARSDLFVGALSASRSQSLGEPFGLLEHERRVQQVERLQGRGRHVAAPDHLAGVRTIEHAERGVLRERGLS